MEDHTIAGSEVWGACYMDSDRLPRRTYRSHHHRPSSFLFKMRAWHHQVLKEIGAHPLTVLIPRGVGYWASS